MYGKKGTPTNPDELYALFNKPNPHPKKTGIDYEALARKVMRDPRFYEALEVAGAKFRQRLHNRLWAKPVKPAPTWDALFNNDRRVQ